MSTLHVENLKGLSSGGNANKIIVPSGQTFSAVGHVIQTVYNSHNTGVTLQAGGAVETGLAASITPKFASSKILVTVAQNIQTSGSSYCQVCLRRGTIGNDSLLSIIVTPEGYNNSSDEEINQLPFSWLDSPSTTSSTRYFVSMERLAGTTIYAQTSTSGTSVSTIVLQEIAQ